jgi:hypothetical protein
MVIQLTERRRALAEIIANRNIQSPAEWLAGFRANWLPNSLQRFYQSSPEHCCSKDAGMEAFDDWPYEHFDYPSRMCAGYWDSVENRLFALQTLGDRAGFTCPEDWFSLRMNDFALIGNALVGYKDYTCYPGLIINATREIYPEIAIQPWRFHRTPIPWVNNGTINVELVQQYFAHFEIDIGINDVREFRNIVCREWLEQNHGYGLYQAISDLRLQGQQAGDWKIVRLLTIAYPEHEAYFEQRVRTPDSVLSDNDERTRRFATIISALDITNPEDWYNYGYLDVNRIEGGSGLLNYYGDSYRRLISALTGLQFHPWMFSGGIGLWNAQLVSDYSSWLAGRLGLPNRESISPENENEWLIFTREILEANYGIGLRRYFRGGMQDVLSGLFSPEYTFSGNFWNNYHSRTQSALEMNVRRIFNRIFPNDNDEITDGECLLSSTFLLECGINSDDLRFSNSNRLMRCDIVHTRRRIFIEVQGQQHYHYSEHFHRGELGNFYAQRTRDNQKRRAISSLEGSTFLEVRYDWNASETELRRLLGEAGIIV